MCNYRYDVHDDDDTITTKLLREVATRGKLTLSCNNTAISSACRLTVSRCRYNGSSARI